MDFLLGWPYEYCTNCHAEPSRQGAGVAIALTYTTMAPAVAAWRRRGRGRRDYAEGGIVGQRRGAGRHRAPVFRGQRGAVPQPWHRADAAPVLRLVSGRQLRRLAFARWPWRQRGTDGRRARRAQPHLRAAAGTGRYPEI